MADNATSQGPRLIAVGGGKGGVGRTLVASGLAVFIAQLGKKVLLVDAQPQAATLGRVFGVSRPGGVLPPWAPSAIDPRGVETLVPNLRLVEVSSELGPRAGIPIRSPRELARASGADVCVIDLGAGVGTRTLDVMLEADSIIAVTTPEHTAVEALYRLVRHAFARRLTAQFRDDPAVLSRLSAAIRSASGPPVPPELAECVGEATIGAESAAWRELHRLKLKVIVNQSRSRADLELGESLVRVAQRRLGPVLEYLGHVEFDDAVFLAARRARPLLVESPSAKASRNLERIARRLMGAESARGHGAHGPQEPQGAPTHYDILALDRGASDEEIRRAYRKTREVFSAESLALAGVMSEEEVSAMVARIEEARDVLLDPSRRRPYDLSITPSGDGGLSQADLVEDTDGDEQTPTAPAPTLTPETEYTGALLKAIREARGIDLRDVAARTKISLPYLRAIEEEDFGVLPAQVYSRGFVTEVAKFFRLDVEQVVRTYLSRMRRTEAR